MNSYDLEYVISELMEIQKNLATLYRHDAGDLSSKQYDHVANALQSAETSIRELKEACKEKPIKLPAS